MTLSIERVGTASKLWFLGGNSDRVRLLCVLLCIGGAEVITLAVEAVGASEAHGEDALI